MVSAIMNQRNPATGADRPKGPPRGPRRNRPRPGGNSPAGRTPSQGGGKPPENRGKLWIYGIHAGLAAVANPRRRVHRIVIAAQSAETLETKVDRARADAGGRPKPEIRDREELDRLLPGRAVHQGLIVETDPLPETSLPRALTDAPETAPILVLDQATDPRNIGATLRSAAAFGACFVIMQDRHAPPETPAMAKAASGALEIVPVVRVPNIARALIILKEAGYWIVGFDAHAPQTVAEANLSGKLALILGAEGSGLRRLTQESCDHLVKIPISDKVESLNVAATAAIALYELAKTKR
jgi:23S rRNA (guanosine2251-2'-O)-methyltransferase